MPLWTGYVQNATGKDIIPIILTREGRKVSLRELAMHIGVSVCRLGEIERGFGDAPTAKEEKKIRAWMEANDE